MFVLADLAVMVEPIRVRLTVTLDAWYRAWDRDRDRLSLPFARAWMAEILPTSAVSLLARFSEMPRAFAVSLAVANRPVTLIGKRLL